jgi:hypothetical protein
MEYEKDLHQNNLHRCIYDVGCAYDSRGGREPLVACASDAEGAGTHGKPK